MLFSKSKNEKRYCRYCGKECSGFRLYMHKPNISFCKLKNGRIISKTTPSGGAIIKAPDWCPKNEQKKRRFK